MSSSWFNTAVVTSPLFNGSNAEVVVEEMEVKVSAFS
jgi:hypothetical protein